MRKPYSRGVGIGSRVASTIVGLVLAISVAMIQGVAEEGYEGGRGLITLEGMSGLFINPTSATIPEQASTVQYCVFFPNNRTDVVGHGALAAYGWTDDLEVGAIANYIDVDRGGDLSAGGPFARWRMTKDDGRMPQSSLGVYSRFGDDALDRVGVFVAAYRRIPITEDGFVRSLGLHLGARNVWLDEDQAETTTEAGYTGVEIQFPLRVYGVAEVSTKDDDVNLHVPYAYGLQWRARGIAMSVAGIQNGNLNDPSFYYGIGYGYQF